MKRRIPKDPVAINPETTSPSDLKALGGGAALASSPTTVSDDFSDVPVKPEDIGGELLPILSKGLYTNPFHALREYVQNAVDADAKLIRIKLTGNSLLIHDDGIGMSLDDLVEARRFGVSQKSSDLHVGFRGIGIYSGYDLCDRLLITSLQAGSQEQNVLEFNFAAMKKLLAANKAAKTAVTPLHELLQHHTRFRKERATTTAAGTTVMLEEISPFHINRLRNATDLKNYILRNLPVDFDVAFTHRPQIKSFLREKVSGYHAVRIQVEINPGETLSIARPDIPNLAAPVLQELKSPTTGQTIAVMWSCLYGGKDGKRKRIPEELADYSGLVYKVKGFTVGDNRRLHHFFKAGNGALYWWYSGEIYVTDENIIPNTERDDFEANQAYEVLQRELKTAMEGLASTALKFQSQQRAEENLRALQVRLATIESEIEAGIGDRPTQFRQLEDIIDELKKQRNKVAPGIKEEARNSEKKATDLRTRVRKLIDDSSKESQRRPESPPTSSAGTQPSTATGEKPEIETLPILVERLALEISPECNKLLSVIDDALDAVLQRGSEQYEAVIREVESSLSGE